MKKIIIIFLAVLFLASCSYLPFANKKDDPTKTGQKQSAQQKVDIEDSKEPKPGDIKVVDGIEYIYARNKKWVQTPLEPENMWIRKDQYSPGIIESMISSASGTSKKERTAMEDRIAKLEEELKKKNLASPSGISGPDGYFTNRNRLYAGRFSHYF